jgi:UPF0716 protein FxsA
VGLYVFLALLLVPLAEIGLFIEIGERIGLWATLGTVVLTAVLGSIMVRAQGLRTLTRARASLERNELPIVEVFDALCLLISGILLLTPGFLTDALGALLFIPPLRAWVRLVVGRKIMKDGTFRVYGADGEVRYSTTSPQDDDVVEGDFEEVRDRPEKDLPPPEDSRWGSGRD